MNNELLIAGGAGFLHMIYLLGTNEKMHVFFFCFLLDFSLYSYIVLKQGRDYILIVHS